MKKIWSMVKKLLQREASLKVRKVKIEIIFEITYVRKENRFQMNLITTKRWRWECGRKSRKRKD